MKPNQIKSNHTPGPWKAQGCEIIRADKMENWQLKVAILPTTIDPRPRADAAANTLEERDANARLIAAAPDLLAALKDVLRYCVTVKGMPDKGKGRTVEQQEAFDSARAALAKAEKGGQ